MVHAALGSEQGEAAFDQLVVLTEGDFVLDPNFLILEQQMDRDVDVLLRESAARRKRAAAAAAGQARPRTSSGSQARRPASGGK